jgi:superfamily II DNA or RNA helicase
MVLRDYQEKALEELINITEPMSVFGSDEIVVLEATTSFGKSVIIAKLAEYYSKQKKKVLIATSISDLIPQLSKTLDSLHIKHSILQGSKSKIEEDANVTLGMMQTIKKRVDELNLDEFEIYIQDEIHRFFWTKTFETITSKLADNAVKIGLTATPYDNLGYKLKNSILVRTVTVDELENQGYLTPVRYIVPAFAEKIDYSDIKIQNTGDFKEEDLDVKYNMDFIKDTVEALTKMGAKNKKIVLVVSSIQKAKELTEELRNNGFHAFEYHSKIKDKKNKHIMEAFRNNELYIPDESDLFNNKPIPVKCLVSISKLSIGFSVDDLDAIGIVRAIGVMSLFVQLEGRVKRIYKPIDEIKKEIKPNKKIAIQTSYYNEIEVIKKQLKDYSNIDYYNYEDKFDESKYDKVFKNIRPNKNVGSLIDFGQNLRRHGFPNEPYDPPERSSENSKEKLEELKNKRALNMLDVLVDNEFNIINREKYDIKLKELRNDKRRLTQLEIRELIARIKMGQTPLEKIAAGLVYVDRLLCRDTECYDMFKGEKYPCRAYEAKNGKLVKDFVNPKAIAKIAEVWDKAIENEPPYIQSKLLQALENFILKTPKVRNNIWWLLGFADTVLEDIKREEEFKQVQNQDFDFDDFDEFGEDIPF